MSQIQVMARQPLRTGFQGRRALAREQEGVPDAFPDCNSRVLEYQM